MSSKKRMTAIKTDINSLLNGEYFEKEGFEPNYILTKKGIKISRARVLGTVVKKFISEKSRFGSITIDDGKGTINAKVFKATSLIENINEGDIVDVFGKVRQYEGEIHINAEIVNKTDIDFELLRILELKKNENKIKEKEKKIKELQVQVGNIEELKLFAEKEGISAEEVDNFMKSGKSDKNPEEKELVLSKIDELDSGNGCDYFILLKEVKIDENKLDSIINELLEEGDCFEPKPGKIKKI